MLYDSLMKAASSAGISAASRIVSALIVNKIAAIYIGPTGFALIGQFQNFSAIVLAIGGNCYSNGIVRRVVETRERGEQAVSSIISTCLVVVVSSSALVATVIYLGRGLVVQYLLGGGLQTASLVFAIFIVPLNLHYAILALLNGLKDAKKFAVINACAGTLTVIVGCVLIPTLGLVGAVLTPIVANGLACVAGYYGLTKIVRIRGNPDLRVVDRQTIRQLFRFGAGALATLSIAPLSALAIRGILLSREMYTEAGYWHAITKVSESYMLPLAMLMSMHYLPRFTRLHLDSALYNRAIYSGIAQVLGGVMVIGAGLFVFRDVAIVTLLSRAFSPMRDMVFSQTMGDAFRGVVLLLENALLARGLLRSCFTAELVFWSIFVLSLSVVIQFYPVGLTITYVYWSSAVAAAWVAFRLATTGAWVRQ